MILANRKDRTPALLSPCSCPTAAVLLPRSCCVPGLTRACSCPHPALLLLLSPLLLCSFCPAYLLLPCSCPALFLLLPCFCPSWPCFPIHAPAHPSLAAFIIISTSSSSSSTFFDMARAAFSRTIDYKLFSICLPKIINTVSVHRLITGGLRRFCRFCTTPTTAANHRCDQIQNVHKYNETVELFCHLSFDLDFVC